MSKKSNRKYGRKIEKGLSGRQVTKAQAPRLEVDLPGPIVEACAQLVRESDPKRPNCTGHEMFVELKQESTSVSLEAFQTWFDLEFPQVYHKFQYRKV